MSPTADNFYARWRLRPVPAGMLHEDGQPPPERLLQSIWQHQRLQREQLKTLDGRTVRVLHPGFANLEGGPDFRNALVQVGEDAPRSGDIEVDLRGSGWRGHGHDRNPAFQSVILHVVWDAEKSFGGPPILPLSRVLDAPLAELNLSLEREPLRSLPEDFRGKCSAPLKKISAEQLTELFHEAARVRLQLKASQFHARARHVGWEQALWEGLFRGLGYKHNVWPMQALAESRLRWSDGADSVLALQARLLGLSGLLPAELPRHRSAGDEYLRQIWDSWWRERDRLAEEILPRESWRLHGLRPANHPQRRLALAAHWIYEEKLQDRIEQWCTASIAEKNLAGSLLKTLQVGEDKFWSWHWTFRSPRFARPQPLLGATRVSDLAVNVILPWLWTRAAEGKNPELQRDIERRYFAWPAAEDNSVLRLARQRLLGGGTKRAFRHAFAQQGLLQIVRDFCDHSNAACDDCPFPRLLGEWSDNGKT